MSDDRQQLLLESLNAIQVSLRTIAASQAATQLYTAAQLRDKIDEHTLAVAAWRSAAEAHRDLLQDPTSTQEIAGTGMSARAIATSKTRAAAGVFFRLGDADPLVEVLVRAAGGSFPSRP